MRKSYLTITILIALAFSTRVLIQGCKSKKSGSHTAADAAAGFSFKDRLSEYGFFEGPLQELKPTGRIINYELATPLFTDYAVKDRFIFLPKDKSIQYTQQGILEFPDSTIIIKNFAYRNTNHQKIMIETRLLVKDPVDKKWKVMNYLWNAEQTDALKHIAGAKVPVTLLDDDNNKISTIYQVPNTNDCKRCHVNNNTLTPIGVKGRNLAFTRNGQSGNQLVQWASQGKLEGMPALENIASLPVWTDTMRFSVGERARAYLDVNCAHCHTKGGDAYNTGLFLEYEQTDKNQLGILKVPVSAGGGAGGLNYDIVPGDAAHSVLAYRMNSTTPGTAMPELARSLIHKEGVQLIIDWINSMKK